MFLPNFKQDMNDNMKKLSIFTCNNNHDNHDFNSIKPRTLKNSKWGTPWELNNIKFANLLTTLSLLLT